jgi:hypothetical protein
VSVGHDAPLSPEALGRERPGAASGISCGMNGVHERGVEPLCLAAPEPKSGAYANFATRALNPKAPQHSPRAPQFKFSAPGARISPPALPFSALLSGLLGGRGVVAARRSGRARSRGRRAQPLRAPVITLADQGGCPTINACRPRPPFLGFPRRESRDYPAMRGSRRLLSSSWQRHVPLLSGRGLGMKSALEATGAGSLEPGTSGRRGAPDEARPRVAKSAQRQRGAPFATRLTG